MVQCVGQARDALLDDAAFIARHGGPQRTEAPAQAVARGLRQDKKTAVEGFTMQHARDASRRSLGLTVALGGIVVAIVLETLLLLRAARLSKARGREAIDEDEQLPVRRVSRVGTVGLALFVALMGFALLAAFLVRLG